MSFPIEHIHAIINVVLREIRVDSHFGFRHLGWWLEQAVLRHGGLVR